MHSWEKDADTHAAKPVIRAVSLNREKREYDIFCELIAEHCTHIRIVGAATSAEEAREMIAKVQPDVLFFDGSISDRSSQELLQELKFSRVSLVFISACEKYALQAIKVNAVDYLLKPITGSDIRDVEQKLLECQQQYKVMAKSKHDHKAFVHAFFDTSMSRKGLRKVVLKHARGFNCVDMNTIVRLEADRNYTVVILDTQKSIVVSRTLNNFEAVLDMDVFVRIHKSHIVNLNYMSGYLYDDAGYVVMRGEKKIEVARRRLHSFLEQVQRLTGQY